MKARHHGPRSPRFVASAVFLLFVPLFFSCRSAQNRLDIVDFAEDGSANYFVEDFDEAYFDLDDQGNLELILRRVQDGRMSDEADVTQVVYLKTIWRSIPGQTSAEDDQINAIFQYVVLMGDTGHSFEGAGSVFFEVGKKDPTVVTGQIGRAVVKPARQSSAIPPLFTTAQLKGAFRATRDPRRVKTIKNELGQLLPPPPIGSS